MDKEDIEMEREINGTRLILVQGDITRQITDAIVNAANSSLMGGGGVDGAIHRAGGPSILEECKRMVARQGRLPTGQAAMTSAGNMKAKYVIHTVGPVWHGGSQGEAELLAGAYRESLKLAADRGLCSISFPSISTGAYGYPLPGAARIALQTVVAFLKERTTSIKQVNFVLFGLDALDAYEAALRETALAMGPVAEAQSGTVDRAAIGEDTEHGDAQRMMRQIRVTAGSVTALAELNDSETADSMLKALPFSSKAMTWGDEVYFSVPVRAGIENGIDVVNMGDLGYWPPGKAFCIFFGPTPMSRGNEIRPASAVNVFGRLLGDPRVFKAVNDGDPVSVDRS